MIHFAYPNVAYPNVQNEHGHPFYVGCVRYRSLPTSEPPPPGYRPATADTPHRTVILAALETLAPECAAQLWPGTSIRLYETADWGLPPGHGSSLNLAYLLALIHCGRSCVGEDVEEMRDVWCTGAIELEGDPRQPVLHEVDPPGFQAKVEGFLAQTRDRFFFVPT